jgi:hypothetical protein
VGDVGVNFSFFCIVPGGPGEIRGKQMADVLGGRFNPESGSEDDCCVYILGSSPKDGLEPRCAYHDVIDCGWARLARVKRKWRNGHIIAVSKVQFEALQEYFPERKLFFIPQHHCNFKRETRPDRPVLRVGCIGGDSAVQWPHHAIARHLAEVGMEWHFEHQYHRRWKVVEFYKTLDIQMSFRPTHERDQAFIRHMNCLKLSNAGSFGIPTVSYPEPAYVGEWKDECLWGSSMRDVLSEVKRLRDDPGLYAEMSARARAKSEEYHIDRIADLYRALPTEN